MDEESEGEPEIKLMLGGDVMTGRGIDQALPHPCDPVIYEPYAESAQYYLQAAEKANGPIPRAADYDYVWGDALKRCRRLRPNLRIINLETSITTSEDADRDKGIQYRMHPENVDVLTAAGIDACALANNHVLDWGRAGLDETLRTLAQAGIRFAGAGRDREEAEAPSVLPAGLSSRVLLFSFATPSSGIPAGWEAGEGRSGIAVLEELSTRTAERVVERIEAERRAGDLVVVSMHWGGNFGYEVPEEQQAFAHRLVERGGADVVHGHSSHHPKAVEVYGGKLILYGCGDLINDYEGIRGYEEYRNDLVLLYFASLEPKDGRLARLEMVPFEIRRFQLHDASTRDAEWLRETMDRECLRFGGSVRLEPSNVLSLQWPV